MPGDELEAQLRRIEDARAMLRHPLAGLDVQRDRLLAVEAADLREQLAHLPWGSRSSDWAGIGQKQEAFII
jgi:hypothetical protein